MTSLPMPTDAARDRRSGPGRPRLRRPSSRAGLTWLVALIVIGVLLALQVGRQVYANYSITQQSAELRQQITAIQVQNDALRHQLDYLRSDAYIGAEARRLENLGRSGERLLIIPPGAEASAPPAANPKTAPPKPLLEQWFDLFFGG
jgi:cell division protein FtsB